MTKLKTALIEIFEKTAAAHHFANPDGLTDHDWAVWYADFLRKPLGRALGRDFSRSELVTCLMAAEDERLAMHGPDHPWPPFYADHFLTRYAPSMAGRTEKLALYYYPECPYCQRVLSAIRETGADVDLRHIWEVPKHRSDLQAARGRTTVPVLRISAGDNSDRWMPESLDIVRYLRERAAN